jgi:gamma-glutamyltranspeptidase
MLERLYIEIPALKPVSLGASPRRSYPRAPFSAGRPHAIAAVERPESISMQHTARGFGGMVTAPHHLAAQAGRDVLADGGNALEAALAAAAVIAVAYPHMNGLGGDAFWLYAAPGEPPRGIDGCGPAGAGATIARYREAGCDAVPVRGPLAANTVAGAVAAWDLAHRAARQWGGRLALERLLEPAIHYARDGVAVTRSLHRDVAAAADELAALPGFADAGLGLADDPRPVRPAAAAGGGELRPRPWAGRGDQAGVPGSRP